MNELTPTAIIAALLARSDISADLRAELQDFEGLAANGSLDADDRTYLQALARRLGLGGDPQAAPAREPTLAEWRARALSAEARVTELEALLAQKG